MATKTSGTAYALWALGLIGIGGLHRFYVGKSGSGLLYLFTFNLFFVGMVLDFFAVPSMVAEANGGLPGDSATQQSGTGDVSIPPVQMPLKAAASAALPLSRRQQVYIGIGVLVLLGMVFSRVTTNRADSVRRPPKAASESKITKTAKVSASTDTQGGPGVQPQSPSADGQVTEADFGKNWPLSVSSGEVLCIPPRLALFRSKDGTMYALNGTAMACIDSNRDPACKGLKVKRLDDIWRDDPSQPGKGYKIPTLSLINAALARCETKQKELKNEALVSPNAGASKPSRNVRDLPLGTYLLKEGYFGAVTKEAFDKAMSLAASNDDAALEKLIATGLVFQLQAGLEVTIVERVGFLSSMVKVRKRGTLAEIWTVREALETR